MWSPYDLMLDRPTLSFDEAAATVSALDATADHRGSPCGSGLLRWRIWGEGPPLVLLHGSFGSWTHWIRNIPALSRQFRVHALDLPGMGDSDEPPLPFTVEGLGAIVADGIDAVVGREVPLHMAGFSFGGIVGGQAALRLGDRLRSFTVVGSNALGLPLDARPPLARPSRSMSAEEILDVHRRNLAIVMFGDPEQIDDLALHLQMTNTARARIRSGEIPRGNSLARALARLSCPIFGIWGERDATAGRYLIDRRRLFEDLPACIGFHVVPGAGHWVAYEAPDEVDAVMAETLLRL